MGGDGNHACEAPPGSGAGARADRGTGGRAGRSRPCGATERNVDDGKDMECGGGGGGAGDLGYMYQVGQGVPRDYGAALRWHRRAAEQGLAWGQASLGYMYREGLGVTRDYGAAVRWYRLAADQGLDWGQASLGNPYEQGLGVPRDDGAAVRWYRLAADQGHAGAQSDLDRIAPEP